MSNQPEVLAPTSAALLSQLRGELKAAEAASRALIAAGKKPGPGTGFPKLDNQINGFLSPGIHTLLAAPGIGKTALALQFAAQPGCPAVYVTSEMSRVELLRRIASRTSKTFYPKMSGGTLSEAALDIVLDAAEAAAPQLAILDATEAPKRPDEIKADAERLKDHFKSDHILIVIDSFTDWARSLAFSSGAQETEYKAIEVGLTSLKRLASLLRAPVLIVVHKNRNSQGTSGAENLFSAKGSGNFEYVSETLWSLDPAENSQSGFNGNDGNKTPVTLTLAKNRYGSRGAKVGFTFGGRFMEFTEVGKEELAL